MEYRIEDNGNQRVLHYKEKQFKTIYTTDIIEAIIARKGIDRTPLYFLHKDNSKIHLNPVFDYLKKNGFSNLKVLEVGCSAGQVTELLNEQDIISSIYTFDIDKQMIDITKAKIKALGLNKVHDLRHLKTRETINLPYENDFFDLVIVKAVVEHLPVEDRHLFVDEYWRVLKMNGIISFLDTPNRQYWLETHSIGLPFVQSMSPTWAFIYSKLFGKLKKEVKFTEFVRIGTAWRNSSYYELLPKRHTFIVEDVTDNSDLGYRFYINRKNNLLKNNIFKLIHWFSRKLNFPINLFLPELNVLFQKKSDIES
jgi:2-polyprenyl-3-methyl-5-hydroxy-6-metoxy-1,4-benzoquinol methylase